MFLIQLYVQLHIFVATQCVKQLKRVRNEILDVIFCFRLFFFLFLSGFLKLPVPNKMR